MKWITREKIKVDRVACPWVIKKFIDPDAEFVFLPRSTDWTKISDGIVFDVPDCELGHHGEDVSFNSILKKYNLTDAALNVAGGDCTCSRFTPDQPARSRRRFALDRQRFRRARTKRSRNSRTRIHRVRRALCRMQTPNRQLRSLRRRWRHSRFSFVHALAER